MKEIKKMLKTLCCATGVAGYEFEASNAAAEFLKKYTDEVVVDDFGSVRGLIKSGDRNAKTLLLDAHIDEIGMVVTAIDDKGFIKFSNSGGVDIRLLSAQRVTVHGKEKLAGVIGSKPPHLETKEEADKVSPMDDMYIDIGYSKEDAEKLVSQGDMITVNAEFDELIKDRVSCKALDDRAGVAAILYALELSKDKKLKYNIVAQFSAMEEIGGNGAKTSAYAASPDMAIAIDVSFAKIPEAPAHKCGELGGGAMIGYHPILDKKISDELVDIAKRKKIKFQLEGMGGRGTGTNADGIILTKSGVPTGLISIPQKYMHSPIEVVDIKDIEATAKLISEFIVKGKE